MSNAIQIFVDLSAATLNVGDAPYGMIKDAAIAVKDGQIVWVGPKGDMPQEFAARERVSALPPGEGAHGDRGKTPFSHTGVCGV